MVDFSTQRGDAEPGFRITFAQLRRFLPQYKWVILGVFTFTTLAAYASLNLITELYDVRSALLVKLGRENLDAPVTARNGVLSTGIRREELGSEVQFLRSTKLIEQVVDQIGVEAFRVTRVPPPGLLAKAKFYTKAGLRWGKARYQDVLIALDLKKRLNERDTAVAMLVDRLVAEPQKESDVIQLSLRLPDPQLGIRIQETLIEKYLAHRVDVRRNRGVKEFFEREVGELRAKLDDAERRATDWRAQSQLTMPSEQKALLLRQIREVSAERERAISRVQALVRQVREARGLMSNAAERVRAAQVETTNSEVQQLRERLTRLEADRAKLLTTYLPAAAPVVIVEAEIATVRQLLTRQKESDIGSVTTALNPIRQQLEQSVNQDSVQLTGLNAEIGAKQRQLDRLHAELRAIEVADVTLLELDRERVLAEQHYLTAVKRLSEADIESELDVSRISNVAVASAPASSLTPVYPRKLLLMALALVLGLVFGIGLAALLEWTSDTVHDAGDVSAATDLACLATFGGRGSEGMA